MRPLQWDRKPWQPRHWIQLLTFFAFTWVVEEASSHNGLWIYGALTVWLGLILSLPRALPSRPFFRHPRA